MAQLCRSAAEAQPQELSNAVYAAALLRDSGYSVDARQAQQLVAALDVSNVLWAVASMGLPLPGRWAQQLVAALVQKGKKAKPLELANALWAAATMGLPRPRQQAQQLVPVLAQQAAPYEVSNALWAAAKRKADFAAAVVEGGVTAIDVPLLQLAAAVSRQQAGDLNPQDVINSLWALSELRLRPPEPAALLAEAALQQAPAMEPQHLSNTAVALARLGLHDARLFAALVDAAVQQGQRFSAVPQHTTNLAWAVAVADQRQLSGAAATLCGQLARRWVSTAAEAHQQLWQVHLWLQDGQPAGGGGGGGLTGALSAAQLQHVDVAATHAASGRRLAIEADGPARFLRPDGQPTGETQARNRALAARGFVVVTLPFWEWGPLRSDEAAQDAYLQRMVEAALQQAQPDLAALQQLEAQHGGSFNFIHTAAAFTRAGHLAAARGARRSAGFHPLLQRLWQRLQPQLGECGPRQLANIVWACSKAGFAEASLLDACMAQLCSSAAEAEPQNLSNAIYAAALLRDSGHKVDERQAQQLVVALVQKRQEAIPQDVSNVLWAAASMGLPLPEQQAQQLVAALVQKRREALPQHLANTLWAAATMGLPLPEQQAQQLVAALLQKQQAAATQHLANALWAAASMRLPLPEQQAQQLVAALVQKRQDATLQHISNTLWAAATMGLPLPEQSWEQLLAALAAKAQQAGPQDVSNALWAVAKRKADLTAAAGEGGVTAVEAALLQLAAGVGKEQAASMSPQAVSNALWALSELGLRPPGLKALLEEAALQQAPASDA
ncbi:MAG: hypothetical protein J3K34DRAFT_517616 [Monoraphidium minutum]|nr:MAG: hypothetical protein J3K34DRAFT_517616 [Monoraphidium minutum]